MAPSYGDAVQITFDQYKCSTVLIYVVPQPCSSRHGVGLLMSACRTPCVVAVRSHKRTLQETAQL